ncbi:MAG: hypothetical protein AAGD38_16685 [Acidobacteriota bacterium]
MKKMPRYDRDHRSANIDPHLLEIGLSMTPTERLRWLEDTVEELLPWLGLAADAESSEKQRESD